MMSVNVKVFAFKTLVYVVLLLILVVVLFPLLDAVFGSFKRLEDIMSSHLRLFPRKWILNNYIEAWTRANFGRYISNSFIISGLSTVGILIVTSMSGFVLARKSIIGKKVIVACLLATMFVSAGSITIYPVFRIAKAFHWTGSLWGLVLVYIFKINTAFIFLFYGYVHGISRELDQAATIDGCGTFAIYWRIIMPLSTPIIATLILLAFRDSWNDFLLPLVFTMAKVEIRPLTVGIVLLLRNPQYIAQWNIMLAGASMALFPIIVLYAILNRYFISGLTSGALKE